MYSRTFEMFKSILFVVLCCIQNYEAARILAFYPTPSFSHQVTFRPLTNELVKRGHEVVVVTPDPAYSNKDRPANLTEIDVHDLSYKIWRENFVDKYESSDNDGLFDHVILIYQSVTEVFRQQMQVEEVQDLVHKKAKPFDLIIVEAYVLPTLGLSHIFKVPVIQMSSFLPVYSELRSVGVPDHPILFAPMYAQKLDDLSIFDKIGKLIEYFVVTILVNTLDGIAEDVVKKVFGPDVPSIAELTNNVDLVFLNTFPQWDSNRPVPPNLIYLGGIHVQPPKELPTNLKSYLDSSKHGVIYVSFGTNFNPSSLPPEKLQAMINVLSRLPYDVLWKYDKDDLPGQSKNIKIQKWLPQADLLRHPKIKFFVTQGGLQSTDEAVLAGVPLLGIPIMADQWFNVGMYLRHKIGVRVGLVDLNEKTFKEAVDALTKDDTFRNNILRFRTLIYDQPQSSVERAVWWTEHVLRNGGGKHLRSPSANVSFSKYYEIPLVTTLLLATFAVIVLLFISIRKIVNTITGKFSPKLKKS